MAALSVHSSGVRSMRIAALSFATLALFGLTGLAQRPDPLESLADVVAAFARFWDAGRPWIRRVRALGVLDPELGEKGFHDTPSDSGV